MIVLPTKPERAPAGARSLAHILMSHLLALVKSVVKSYNGIVGMSARLRCDYNFLHHSWDGSSTDGSDSKIRNQTIPTTSSFRVLPRARVFQQSSVCRKFGISPGRHAWDMALLGVCSSSSADGNKERQLALNSCLYQVCGRSKKDGNIGSKLSDDDDVRPQPW